MTLSTTSWLLLLVQLALVIGTAVVAPITLGPRLIHYVLFSIAAAITWFMYAFIALLFDSKAGNDVPAAGYLFIGGVAWCVGSIIFIIRNGSPK